MNTSQDVPVAKKSHLPVYRRFSSVAFAIVYLGYVHQCNETQIHDTSRKVVEKAYAIRSKGVMESIISV